VTVPMNNVFIIL